MPFERDSLETIRNRIQQSYRSHLSPLTPLPRYNLMQILAAVDAGIYHQLQGDIFFLSRQIFANTAEGEYLRAHFTSQVTPLLATPARGRVLITGTAETAIPSGLAFRSDSGQGYFNTESAKLGVDGSVSVDVQAVDQGVVGNLEADTRLKITSTLPVGIDATVTVTADGIGGGIDAETDAEYRYRVLEHLKNPIRNGKRGDYAILAVDSSPQVTRAWEFPNFGVFGAVLIQVIGGNTVDGITRVVDLESVKEYLERLIPLSIFTIQTPELIDINPGISITPNTTENQDTMKSRIRKYLDAYARPGATITAAALRNAIVDGFAIIEAEVTIDGSTAGERSSTILQYPVLGEIT